MDKDELMRYCLSKKGTFLDFPFGPHNPLVKIRKDLDGNGRIFAEFFSMKGVSRTTFRTDEATALMLRQMHPNDIVRGYHCPPAQAKYASTVILNGDVDDKMILEIADISYNYVLTKIPKRIRDLIVGSNGDNHKK